MKKNIFILLCIFFSTVALADMKIVQNVKSSAAMGQPAKDSQVTMWIKGSKMKIENQAQPGYQIIDVTEGKAYLVDPAKKEVLVMTTEQMKQAAGMMASMMGGQNTKPKVEKLGTTKTLNGHKCDEYKVTLSSPVQGTSLSCIASDIDTTELEPFKAFSEGFAQMFGEAMQMQGLPVHSESNLSIMGQNISTSSDLVSISRDKVADSVFVIPAEYKSRPMQMPGQN